MIAMYRSFGLFLGIFAVLVGGLGMMNTMLMSVLERTREIGVLRALGWKRRRIITMIVGEALIVALGGGALGILLGVGLTELARTAPSVEALLQDTLTPYILAQAIGIAVVLGTVGGLYPAWRASKLQPVEAMRYEAGAGDLGRFAQWLVRMFGRGALRNLWRRPGRTFVTVTGIGIGVGFIVALIAMVDGFSIIFTQMASAGQADLMAEEANVSDMSLSEIDDRVYSAKRWRIVAAKAEQTAPSVFQRDAFEVWKPRQECPFVARTDTVGFALGDGAFGRPRAAVALADRVGFRSRSPPKGGHARPRPRWGTPGARRI